MLLRTLDVPSLAAQFRNARPYPHVCIDDFLDPSFALEIARSYPSFEAAVSVGRSFDAVNEKRKVQITDVGKFPDPVKRLSELLAGPSFLHDLSQISGIPRLLYDPSHNGGGLHQTARSGHLDVHVDFNRLPTENGEHLYRRLNLLLYLNPQWDDGWGGRLELWDRDVTSCERAIEPLLNRCVIFETSDHSYHAAAPVACPPGMTRKSFALYFYTREAPEDWDGKERSTVFRARPDETWKRYVEMPGEATRVAARRLASRVAGKARRIIVGLRSH